MEEKIEKWSFKNVGGRTITTRMNDLLFIQKYIIGLRFIEKRMGLDLHVYDDFKLARGILSEDYCFYRGHKMFMDSIATQNGLDINTYRGVFIAKQVFLKSLKLN